MTQHTVRHYQIRSTLAKGTDSVVYLAFDNETSQSCVLKRLFVHQLDAWKRFDLFKREAQVLAQLEHPQIPQLWDYFIDEDDQGKSIYLVQEKAPGISLLKRVLDGWVLSEEQCHAIAIQLLDILIYLHGKHPPVIHRDIKPSNLLLDDNGTLYLLDFGGVQETLKYEGGGGSTIVGTFGYMAPEQFTGRALPQTDLYGLGATLIYLLSAHEPANMPQQNMLVQFRTYVECSAVFANWIESLIAPSLKERFQSAEQALEVLKDTSDLYHPQRFTPPKIKPFATKRKMSVEDVSQVKIEEKPLPEPASHGLQIGYTLKNTYKIQKVLAQGSVVMTYDALRTEDNTEVIIKAFHFERMDNWKSFELFEREIQTLSQLNHPQIPKMLEHFHHTDTELCFYIVTEKIQGQTLQEKLVLGWRPTEENVKDLARQLLPVLSQLHQFSPKVIHRDIKPSNLMLTPQGKLVLIDFGAVQDLTKIKGGGGSTVIGTYGYMAPEQFTGHATPLSDLYSLGATLAHCLSGTPPSEMIHEDLKLHFRPLVNCNENFAWWLERLLEPQPQNRFSSADEALQTLGRLGNLRRTTQDQSKPMLALPTYNPTEKDKAIEIFEGPQSLQFKIRPNYHDFKLYLGILGGVNLFLVPFLLTIPGLGPTLALLMLFFQLAMIVKIMNDGEKKTLQIEVTPEYLRVESYSSYHKMEGEKPFDFMETGLDGIKQMKIESTELHNRLVIRVQHSSQGYPVVYRSKLSLAPNKRKAEYILARLKHFMHQFQTDSQI